MSQPIEDRVGHDGIGEHGSPVGHRAIAGDDHRTPGIAAVDDRVEELGCPLVKGAEGKVIDDEQIHTHEFFHKRVQPVIEISRRELDQEPVPGIKYDGVCPSACRVSNGLGEMGFAGAGGAEKEDAVARRQKITGCQFPDMSGVDRWIEGEVERLDRLFTAESRLGQGSCHFARGAGRDLVRQEHREKLRVGELVLLSLQESQLDIRYHRGEFERSQLRCDLGV